MSERYKTLYRLPENLYSIGSPVIIAAGALLKDNQSGKVLAQIKFKSISDKRIKAVKIKIFSFDVAGLSVGDAVEHQYLDLNVNRNTQFGSKEAVPLAIDTTRSFCAQVSSVIFSDGSIWESSNDAEWDPLLSQPKLSSVLKHDKLVEQYMIETESIGEFVPKEIADLWLCSCGTVNHKSEEHCVSCEKALTGLLAGLDVSILMAKKDARLEAQCAAGKIAEEVHLQKQKENKKITRKILLIAAVASALIIVAIILSTFVFIPQGKYSKAFEMFDTGNYAEAEMVFSELGEYKDSLDMANECIYHEAIILVDAKNYADAISLFTKLGEYKDSLDMANECIYHEAIILVDAKNYADAISLFTKLGEYKDSLDMANECIYHEAIILVDAKNYDDAISLFTKMGE